MAITLQLRRDSEASWAAVNPILADGEIGFEQNTSKFKIGNGVDTWNTLKYFVTPDDLNLNVEDLVNWPAGVDLSKLVHLNDVTSDIQYQLDAISSGSTGYTGSQGNVGYTGSASTVAGYTGSQGDAGVQGYTGSQGDAGVQGYTGSQGDAGYTGSQGNVGYTGSASTVVGYTGSQGESGLLGAVTNLAADTTLVSNAAYSYSAGGLTLTLPASPADGDIVILINLGTNLTTIVAGNGNTIMGLAENLTINTANISITLKYVGGSDWRIV